MFLSRVWHAILRFTCWNFVLDFSVTFATMTAAAVDIGARFTMKTCFVSLCIVASVALATAADSVVLENRSLRVEIAPDSGRVSVREKTSDHLWQQAAQ